MSTAGVASQVDQECTCLTVRMIYLISIVGLATHHYLNMDEHRPGWTLELAGMDITKFKETLAATVHNVSRVTTSKRTEIY